MEASDEVSEIIRKIMSPDEADITRLMFYSGELDELILIGFAGAQTVSFESSTEFGPVFEDWVIQQGNRLLEMTDWVLVGDL